MARDTAALIDHLGWRAAHPSILNPAPCTLHPVPHTLHPVPVIQALNLEPGVLDWMRLSEFWHMKHRVLAHQLAARE